ncbi:MAG: hypothetical protein A2Z34_09175 [Planctomycetes bacterium RBG_16_59_8]|nr:MAG: hypothetical protein A2Z34_09175 [Planctomycetes bacterium RBG_16_59_8]
MTQESIQRLKEMGIVTTSQRIEILDLIKNTDTHPTAEEVYHLVKERFPTISLATVYNILEKFVEVGEVRQLSIRREKACFDGQTHTHHHFYCNKCKKISNVEIACPVAKSEHVCGHNVEELQAYFYGVCQGCLKKG